MAAYVDRQALERALSDALYDGAFVDRVGDRMPVFTRTVEDGATVPAEIVEWLPYDGVVNVLADAVERVLAEALAEDELAVKIAPGQERLVFTSGLGAYYEPADDPEGELFDEDSGGMSARNRVVLRGLLGLALKRLDEHERPPRPPLGGLFHRAEAAEQAAGGVVSPTTWRFGGESS